MTYPLAEKMRYEKNYKKILARIKKGESLRSIREEHNKKNQEEE